MTFTNRLSFLIIALYFIMAYSFSQCELYFEFGIEAESC
jgi:hypothetical protein